MLTLVPQAAPAALPDMRFDPINKVWIGNEEDEDIFKDLTIEADSSMPFVCSKLSSL